MPTRHGINATARSFFTYNERVKFGYGTQKVRYGKDSQLPFGHCFLSLAAAKDPVATPSGHIYSREAIMTYLLNKKQELKRAKVLYEQQQAEEEAKEEDTQLAIANQDVDKFVKTQEGLSGANTFALEVSKDKQDRINRKRTVAQMTRQIDRTDKATKLRDLKRTSFWVPSFTPTAAKSKLQKPPKRPASPMSGQPLKFKDLIPVKLCRDEEASAKSHSAEPVYICPVSQKQITTQPLVLIKNTGTVVIEKYFKELVLPSRVCPVTSKKFKPKKDIIQLVHGGSSFAGGGAGVAKSWRPSG